MPEPRKSDVRAKRDSYIATAPCGCTFAARVGAPDAQMLKDAEDGATIDRVTSEEARARLVVTCSHTPKWGGMP